MFRFVFKILTKDTTCIYYNNVYCIRLNMIFYLKYFSIYLMFQKLVLGKLPKMSDSFIITKFLFVFNFFCSTPPIIYQNTGNVQTIVNRRTYKFSYLI